MRVDDARIRVRKIALDESSQFLFVGFLSFQSIVQKPARNRSSHQLIIGVLHRQSMDDDSLWCSLWVRIRRRRSLPTRLLTNRYTSTIPMLDHRRPRTTRGRRRLFAIPSLSSEPKLTRRGDRRRSCSGSCMISASHHRREQVALPIRSMPEPEPGSGDARRPASRGARA